MKVKTRVASLAAAIIASLVLALSAMAQDAPAPTTIAGIDRGETLGEVYLEGAALDQLDDEAYLFSDGTGVIDLGIDTASAELPVPLYELIGVRGTASDGAIEVTSWELLPIMTPAVIVPEEDVIRAFQGWIVAFGSQEPTQ